MAKTHALLMQTMTTQLPTLVWDAIQKDVIDPLQSIQAITPFSLTATMQDEYTPLQYAVHKSAYKVMAYFLSLGPALNADPNKRGRPLRLAHEAQDYHMMNILLKAGADPMHTSLTEMSLWRAACLKSPSIPTLTTILRMKDTPEWKHSLVNDVDGKTGSPILHSVVGSLLSGKSSEAISIVNLLLMNGADLDLGDSQGLTVLHTAALVGTGGVVQLLLLAGANPHKKDGQGIIPLSLAKMRPSSLEKDQVVQLLQAITNPELIEESDLLLKKHTDDEDETSQIPTHQCRTQ